MSVAAGAGVGSGAGVAAAGAEDGGGASVLSTSGRAVASSMLGLVGETSAASGAMPR